LVPHTGGSATDCRLGHIKEEGIGNKDRMTLPIIEVAFKHDKWWSIPPSKSRDLYWKYMQGQNAEYQWNWGVGGRAGSWKQNGQTTRISRYHIDFRVCVQTNLDNQRKRSIRIIWVRPEDVKPEFTGDLPTTEQ